MTKDLTESLCGRADNSMTDEPSKSGWPEVLKSGIFASDGITTLVSLIEYFPQGLALIFDGTILAANQSLTRVLARDQRLPGSRFTAALNPAQAENIAAQISEHLSATLPCTDQSACLHISTSLKRGNGSLLPVQLQIIPIALNSGSGFLMVCDVPAVGSNVNCDEARLRFVADLYRLAVVGEIAASLIHELGQGLTVIRSSVDILKEFAKTGERLGAEPVQRTLELLARSGDSTSEWIHRIWNFLKADKPAFTSVYLPDVIADCVDLIRPSARHSGISIVADVPSDLPVIVTDSSLLRLVLVRLLKYCLSETITESNMYQSIFLRVSLRPQRQQISIVLGFQKDLLQVADPTTSKSAPAQLRRNVRSSPSQTASPVRTANSFRGMREPESADSVSSLCRAVAEMIGAEYVFRSDRFGRAVSCEVHLPVRTDQTVQ